MIKYFVYIANYQFTSDFQAEEFINESAKGREIFKIMTLPGTNYLMIIVKEDN